METHRASAWQVRHEAGQQHAVVRVRNLRTKTLVPTDAWGRQLREQPVLISVEVCLRTGFALAAKDDELNGLTVHYGELSKTVLAAVEEPRAPDKSGLNDLLDVIRRCLVGDASAEPECKGFLNMAIVSYLTITIHMPKASLLGDGVSIMLTEATALKHTLQSRSLHLHDLRVPTLIGVNAHERKAKQVVIADIEFENLRDIDRHYAILESMVSSLMAQSSFHTLEALGKGIGEVFREYFEPEQTHDGIVHIRLEKPTAVTMAEAAGVEFTMDF